MNPFELHPERLSTTDETGRRVYLYTADVKGKFRSRRTVVQVVLLAVFLGLPWVTIGGRQALLLDVSRREFEIFGLSLRAHNTPLLFLVLAALGFGLFFVTAIWGRVWCGWACPQTVFIDGVFRRIERWIEGPALERRKLARDPLSFKKLWKLTAKWTLFSAASLIITHSFLAYFVGTERLAKMISSSPLQNWESFLFILVTTGIVLFDFAWFREQFCTIICPYGRFQSILMDSHSTVVAYDEKRGELRATPQAKALAKTHGRTLGDCVNCYRCVQVCPVGIDIRRGTQMECIACTACIDACDDVMTKVGKPTGLIRYDSEISLKGRTRKKWRPRSLAYAGVSLSSLLALFVFASATQKIDVLVLRAKEVPYTIVGNGESQMVHNHFKLELSNQTAEDAKLDFQLSESDRVEGIQLITAIRPLPLASGEMKRADIFIRFPATVIKDGVKKVNLQVLNRVTSEVEVDRIEKEMTLVGPLN
ncbi:MAG: cytochrome c oxidase accessory protein CcoG [Bdellovibrionota bacterium]